MPGTRFKSTTHPGPPVVSGDITAVPHCVAWELVTPWGGAVWSRPGFVEVTRADALEVIRIRNVTRWVLVAGAGLVFGLQIAARRRAGRPKKERAPWKVSLAPQ